MIVRIRYNNGGDRFEDVMNVNNREEAIQEAMIICLAPSTIGIENV